MNAVATTTPTTAPSKAPTRVTTGTASNCANQTPATMNTTTTAVPKPARCNRGKGPSTLLTSSVRPFGRGHRP